MDAVQGRTRATQKIKDRLIDQVEYSVSSFIKEAVFASGFAEFVLRLPGCRIDQMTGQCVIIGQVLAADKSLHPTYPRTTIPTIEVLLKTGHGGRCHRFTEYLCRA